MMTHGADHDPFYCAAIEELHGVTLKSEIAYLLAKRDREIGRLKALLDEATTNPEGDYYLGLRCGVEDRDIHDRYDAVEYGWDQAFEYVGSVAAGGSVKDTGDR